MKAIQTWIPACAGMTAMADLRLLRSKFSPLFHL
jgi:hypothetical protein